VHEDAKGRQVKTHKITSQAKLRGNKFEMMELQFHGVIVFKYDVCEVERVLECDV